MHCWYARSRHSCLGLSLLGLACLDVHLHWFPVSVVITPVSLLKGVAAVRFDASEGNNDYTRARQVRAEGHVMLCSSDKRYGFIECNGESCDARCKTVLLSRALKV